MLVKFIKYFKWLKTYQNSSSIRNIIKLAYIVKIPCNRALEKDKNQLGINIK